LISAFICSKEIFDGSYSTKAERPGKETAADRTPSKEFNFFSTWAEQEAQAMPTTGIVFVSILYSFLFDIISIYGCKSNTIFLSEHYRIMDKIYKFFAPFLPL
jgi:hypothetical protein